MARRTPCKSCPWRVDQTAQDIPNFSLELAENLRGSCTGELGASVFSCHLSREGDEFPCAGWMAIYGYDSITVRMLHAQGVMEYDAEAVMPPPPDWPELHADFDEVIQKLRDTVKELYD